METGWQKRLAGASVAVVGALNLGVAVTVWVTDLIRLSSAVGGGFAAVGLLCLALGAMVWRGHRTATIGAFALFAVLWVTQVIEQLTGTGDPVAAGADAPVARLVVLGVVVVTLAAAAWRVRTPTPTPTRDVEAATR